MITRKLSKAQGFVVQGLASQLTQLQVQANEIQAALNEQAELARLKYKLPEGDAQDVVQDVAVRSPVVHLFLTSPIFLQPGTPRHRVMKPRVHNHVGSWLVI